MFYVICHSNRFCAFARRNFFNFHCAQPRALHTPHLPAKKGAALPQRREKRAFMHEDYIITINGTMEQGDQSDSVKLMTRGSFLKRNNNFFITYHETEATGYKGCVTTVKVEGSDKVSMLRFGPAPSQLVIETGRRHVCHYDTGEGHLSLGVAADEISSHLGEHGGSLRFSYLLDVDAESISRNTVRITVKRAM